MIGEAQRSAEAKNRRRRQIAQARKARNGKLYAMVAKPGSLIPKRAASRRSASAGNAGNGSKWIRKERRLRIYARDGFACVWCGAAVGTPTQLLEAAPGALRLATLDHFLARSKGGTNRSENLLTCCMQCNHDRDDTSALAWAAKIERDGMQRGLSYAACGVAGTLQRALEALGRPLPK